MQVLKFYVFLDVKHVTRPVVCDDLKEQAALIFKSLTHMEPQNPQTQHHTPKTRVLNL